MTIAELERPSPETADNETAKLGARVIRGSKGAIALARRSAAAVIEHVPGTVRATRAGARRATTALQRLPDSTLRWLTAGSVGLAAGLQLTGAPRLVRAAGAAPALLMGAAIALRPTAPAIPSHDHDDQPAGGTIDMTDEHTKGAISKARGKVEAGLGKLTGDKEMQAHGKAKQVQGETQERLGDIQDAVRTRRTTS